MQTALPPHAKRLAYASGDKSPYIEEGNQKVGGGVYGKSITDACLGWEASERLIYDLAELNY